MRVSARVLSVAIVLAWTAGLLRSSAAEESPTERTKLGHCGCSQGEACWHYLRTPLRPPEDPCRCGVCLAKGDCSTRERPEGWGATCMGSQKPECFWKRHAKSWGIRCSTCWADTECTACDELLALPDAEGRAQLEKQQRLEGGEGKKKVLVGWSEHFYVAVDIPRLKVFAQGGAPRIADQHELVHLFLERAEKAWDDWFETWGEESRLGERMAIYLAERNSRKESWQLAYFGNSKTNMIYGGGEGKIAGGFCWNGFATSLDDHGSDRDLHAYVRHMIGHILFSCWHGVSGLQKNCPKWAFVGAADWLCRKNPLFADWTTFCHDEGGGANGSGKDWDKKARIIAANKHDPIEKLFAVPSLSHLSYDDHVRSWSYMDLMLREDRERWLATMRGIREGKEHAQAFQAGLGMTPDDFDKRWVERQTGKRRTMADVPKDAGADAEGPTASALRRVRGEQDPAMLAALLRGLDRLTDVKSAETVLGRFSMDSDLVRETLVLLLSKTEAPEIVEWIREHGLSDPDSMVRAHVARVMGNLKHAPARAQLEALLGDRHWLVRANAARALSDIADPAAVPALLAHVEDENPKAWISKADALSGFGEASAKATVPVANRLGDKDWQVRLTACRALSKFGTADAMDPLIERLETEGGRLRREIHAALKAVSNENFSDNPQFWRDWWKKQKPKGIPKEEPPANPEDDRYAKPKKPGEEEATYYGRRIFSQSVLFVLDVSLSMNQVIEVPEEAQQKLGRLPKGQRIQVAKQAVTQALGKLDPRARFNVVFFSTLVRPWQKTLVPAAPGTRDAAVSAVMSAALEDETNIHGALRAAVGLHDKPTLAADLDPIPDTIYFLTDGTPTRGEITDTETLLSWMRDVNRFAKVDLHVIAMGNVGVDLDFLRRLAAENGGEFIHVPDR
jgi:HEAT repeat protein